jgi:hypothetical protein
MAASRRILKEIDDISKKTQQIVGDIFKGLTQ